MRSVLPIWKEDCDGYGGCLGVKGVEVLMILSPRQATDPLQTPYSFRRSGV